MGEERNHQRSELGPRSVESAVLAIVIERHPMPLAPDDLLAEMKIDADDPGRAGEVDLAVTGLLGVGLLVSREGFLSATPAALRAGELELGL